MQPLIFTFSESNTARHVKLVPCAVSALPRQNWEELSDYIGREPSLRPCSPETLEERWRNGLASIAVRDDRIVSFISLVPVMHASTWGQFQTELRCPTLAKPSIDMYGSSTGWTLHEWRKKGISLQLRTPLLERYSDQCNLYMGVTVGFGASPLLVRFGWRIAGWSEFPFVGALAGLPLVGFEDKIGSAWVVPSGMVQYEGPHIPFEQFDSHPWKRYCHLWYSGLGLAKELDDQLARLVNGDLNRWRGIVAAVFSLWPESPWTLHIFGDWADSLPRSELRKGEVL